MKKIIAFDFGKTLFDTSINWDEVIAKENEILSESLKAYSKSKTPAATSKSNLKIDAIIKLYRSIQEDNRTIARNINIELTELKSLREALFKKNLKLTDEEIIPIIDKISQIRVEYFKPVDGVIETLKQLKQKGYILGILSNNTWHNVVEWTLKKYNLDNLFDVQISSSFAQYRKPDPQIFMSFKQDLRDKKLVSISEDAEYWIVGDRLYYDVLGGKQAKFKTILLKTDDKDESMDQFKKRQIAIPEPDFKIEKFSEIANIIN